MRIQSINTNTSFRKLEVLRPETYTPELLKTVKNHKDIIRLAELVEERCPGLSLRCQLFLKSFDTVKNKSNTSLVVYASDKHDVLKSNISILKTYEATDLDSLSNEIGRDKLDLNGILDNIKEHYSGLKRILWQ